LTFTYHRCPLFSLIKYGKAGINLILRRSDIELFRTALHEDLNRLRHSLGDSASDTEVGDLVISDPKTGLRITKRR